MRNKLIIALALSCALGLGSTTIANAQCGDMGGSMHKTTHKRSKKRHARKHRRGTRKATTNNNANTANQQ